MRDPHARRAMHHMLRALETIDELEPLNPGDPYARELAQELHYCAVEAVNATRKYLTHTKETNQ